MKDGGDGDDEFGGGGGGRTREDKKELEKMKKKLQSIKSYRNENTVKMTRSSASWFRVTFIGMTG